MTPQTFTESLPLTSHQALPRQSLTLSVVIPMKDEELNVDRTVHELVSALHAFGIEFELVIVDDGSTDRSAERVQAWQRSHPEIRLISHSYNRGYGAALKSGLHAAENSIVFYTDMDLPLDLRHLPQILRGFDEADAVVGYRSPYSGSILRRMLSLCYNGLCSVVFGHSGRDIGFACKAVRSDLLHSLMLESDSGWLSAELLIKLRQRHARVKEIPVRYVDRLQGSSKMTSFTSIGRILQDLLRQRRRMSRKQ